MNINDKFDYNTKFDTHIYIMYIRNFKKIHEQHVSNAEKVLIFRMTILNIEKDIHFSEMFETIIMNYNKDYIHCLMNYEDKIEVKYYMLTQINLVMSV